MAVAALVCSIVAFIAAGIAVLLSVWNTIHLQAQRLSTHTVIPVSPDTTTAANLEEQLSKIVKDAGGNFNDLNQNLHGNGLDPDDLV